MTTRRLTVDVDAQPGEDGSCDVCGTRMPWIENDEPPHLSGWLECQMHAAAPELLERAKVLLDRLQRNDRRGLRPAIDALADAVKRAEGVA